MPERSEPDDTADTVFVPSDESDRRSSRRRRRFVLGLLVVVLLVTTGGLILWPRLKPRPSDPVERVAESYLKALVDSDSQAQRRLSTVDEPPAIRGYRKVTRDRSRTRVLKSSFAPLAALHGRIVADYTFDSAIGRFTPRHPLGAAAETLDAIHEAKEQAEKSGLYKKMESGDPDDIFDAAENLGQVFSKLAEGALAPKRILPTYRMLAEDSKPPLPPELAELTREAAQDPKGWDALLGRPFHTLRSDGPFIFERAEVDALVTDKLASLGDPPTMLRLSLTRFRLEGIDTGWRVVAARRILPEQGTASQSNRVPDTHAPSNSSGDRASVGSPGNQVIP